MNRLEKLKAMFAARPTRKEVAVYVAACVVGREFLMGAG